MVLSSQAVRFMTDLQPFMTMVRMVLSWKTILKSTGGKAWYCFITISLVSMQASLCTPRYGKRVAMWMLSMTHWLTTATQRNAIVQMFSLKIRSQSTMKRLKKKLLKLLKSLVTASKKASSARPTYVFWRTKRSVTHCMNAILRLCKAPIWKL